MSQVAYDRFVVELPPAAADYRPLADPETVAETAAWLWDFGPTPLVAVVGYDGAAPSWLSAWSPSTVRWAPQGAKTGAAVVLSTPADLERFLCEGAPHERTVLLWPSISEAKTFEALHAGGAAWLEAIDAHAQISHEGERFEVNQITPA
ncbi:MAG: hypothetical protein ACRDF9_06560 [Candidatus Limnocylindria bacterium]